MDHFNQRVRSGRTHATTKSFIVSKIWSTHFTTIYSKIFETIGVSEIGHIFFDRPWRLFLGSGITCAVFHKAGIITSRSEVLKSAVKWAASVLSLRTHAGTLSGPTGVFTLICCKAFDIFGWELVLNIKHSKFISQPWEITAKRY